MACAIAIHKMPEDREAYVKRYFDIHAPLTKKIPGLLRYRISQGDVSSVFGGETAYGLIAIMEYDSFEDIQRASESPEGQAAIADVPNFISDPDQLEVLYFETVDF